MELLEVVQTQGINDSRGSSGELKLVPNTPKCWIVA